MTKKTWIKPALEVTDIRLARHRFDANPDSGVGLLTKNNQPS